MAQPVTVKSLPVRPVIASLKTRVYVSGLALVGVFKDVLKLATVGAVRSKMVLTLMAVLGPRLPARSVAEFAGSVTVRVVPSAQPTTSN